MDATAALLATLHEGRRELRERGVDLAEDKHYDDDLIDALRSASHEFEDRTGKWFQPRVESRYFDALSTNDGGDLDGLDLLLDRELYELTALINGDGSTISDYTLLPKAGPPYTKIRIASTAYWAVPADTGDPVDAIQVDGVWVGGQPGQWFSAVDTLVAGVGTGDILITLDWSVNLDPFLREPRFSPGQLLRWSQSGATEYLAVLAADFDNNQLTVRRGERGTTPIAPDDDTPIDVWRVDERVQLAVAVEGAYRFARRGNFQLSEVDQAGVYKRYATGNTQRFEDTIAEYTNRGVIPRIRGV